LTTIIASQSTCPRVGEVDALARRLEATQLQLIELETTGKDLRSRILVILVEDDLDTVSTIHGQCQHVRKPILQFRSGEVTKAAKVVEEAEKALKLAKANLGAAQDRASLNGKSTVTKVKHELRFVMPK
jgi:cellobiose-specific phosphotransferase system component IIA